MHQPWILGLSVLLALGLSVPPCLAEDATEIASSLPEVDKTLEKSGSRDAKSLDKPSGRHIFQKPYPEEPFILFNSVPGCCKPKPKPSHVGPLVGALLGGILAGAVAHKNHHHPLHEPPVLPPALHPHAGLFPSPIKRFDEHPTTPSGYVMSFSDLPLVGIISSPEITKPEHGHAASTEASSVDKTIQHATKLKPKPTPDAKQEMNEDNYW